ncbi:MAG: methyltransferase domain-containing protein [Bdellovibrionales bacterium]|nr:methyltransferase domain-containing protein [Bdellovibrionales bacterium]
MENKTRFSTGFFPQLMIALFSGGWKRLLKNVYLDLRFGGRFLGGAVRSPGEERGFLHTMNTDYRVFEMLFDGVRLSPDDVLVDVGCGKGRLFNFMLSGGWRGRMVGVEVNPAIAAFTRNRLRRHENVEIIEADVTMLRDVPGTVFYLFNPFTAPVMERFLQRLEEKWSRLPGGDRPLMIYNNAVELAAFERFPRWKIVERFTPEESGSRSGCVKLVYR